jgi:hypothetical protein
VERWSHVRESLIDDWARHDTLSSAKWPRNALVSTGFGGVSPVFPGDNEM